MLFLILLLASMVLMVIGIFSISDIGDNFLAIGLIGLVVNLIFLFGSLICSEITKNNHEMKHTPWADLVALNDGSQTHGTFGIFSGQINEENYYFYYYKTYEPEGFKQGQVPVSNTRIIEKADAPAQLVKIEDAECNHVHWWGWDSCKDSTWEIIVPPGTVVQQYNLDLEN